LLAVQYVGLALVPALLFANPDTPFIASIILIALTTALIVEWLLTAPRWKRVGIASTGDDVRASAVWGITLIGAIAALASTLLGARTYASQLGITAAAPIATLLTPFVPWLVFGCAFALAYWRLGRVSLRQMVAVIGLALVIQLLAVIMLGSSGPLMQLALALGWGFVAVGFFRARWLWVGLAVAALAWMVLFQIQITTRQQIAGSTFGPTSAVDALTRLREDLLLQRAATFGQSLSVEQPGPLVILRFGLIPRALDQDRGALPSGTGLNVALGSSSYSATTFTTLGTIWSLNGGYLGVVVWVGLVSLAFTLFCRRITAARLAFGMLLSYDLVWIESTYPDNLAGLLQGLISLSVALTVLWVTRFRHRPLTEPQSRETNRHD
jgi:hypothetical protein